MAAASEDADKPCIWVEPQAAVVRPASIAPQLSQAAVCQRRHDNSCPNWGSFCFLGETAMVRVPVLREVL